MSVNIYPIRDIYMEHSYVKENRRRERLADSFSALSALALMELRGKGADFVIVCGPITTGGRGSVEENVRAIRLVIDYLGSYFEEKVFDQLPYEATLWSLKDEWEAQECNSGYCLPILEEFYLPIYQSGLIVRAYFLPGWESSFGACWEREQLMKLPIAIIDFPEENFDQLLETSV